MHVYVCISCMYTYTCNNANRRICTCERVSVCACACVRHRRIAKIFEALVANQKSAYSNFAV